MYVCTYVCTCALAAFIQDSRRFHAHSLAQHSRLSRLDHATRAALSISSKYVIRYFFFFFCICVSFFSFFFTCRAYKCACTFERTRTRRTCNNNCNRNRSIVKVERSFSFRRASRFISIVIVYFIITRRPLLLLSAKLLFIHCPLSPFCRYHRHRHRHRPRHRHRCSHRVGVPVNGLIG